MTVIFSKTGELHGAGSAPYKWVSRLTRREREAVKQGALVVIRSRQKRWQHAGHPPYRKAVLTGKYRWVHRVPTPGECLHIEQALQKRESD